MQSPEFILGAFPLYFCLKCGIKELKNILLTQN